MSDIIKEYFEKTDKVNPSVVGRVAQDFVENSEEFKIRGKIIDEYVFGISGEGLVFNNDLVKGTSFKWDQDGSAFEKNRDKVRIEKIEVPENISRVGKSKFEQAIFYYDSNNTQPITVEFKNFKNLKELDERSFYASSGGSSVLVDIINDSYNLEKLGQSVFYCDSNGSEEVLSLKKEKYHNLLNHTESFYDNSIAGEFDEKESQIVMNQTGGTAHGSYKKLDGMVFFHDTSLDLSSDNLLSNDNIRGFGAKDYHLFFDMSNPQSFNGPEEFSQNSAEYISYFPILNGTHTYNFPNLKKIFAEQGFILMGDREKSYTINIGDKLEKIEDKSILIFSLSNNLVSPKEITINIQGKESDFQNWKEWVYFYYKNRGKVVYEKAYDYTPDILHINFLKDNKNE